MKASEAQEIKLLMKYPPIEKMDASLSTLVACTHLSLSTNTIEKIANLSALKNLKILSLGRNNIKSLTGLEAVGDTLEQLWISYNQIEKLKGLSQMKKLKILLMTNNQVKEMSEVSYLSNLPCLEEVLLVGNPVYERMEAAGEMNSYRQEVSLKCKKLKKLDGIPVVREEE
ncbi:dynein axonemal light chain 1-like isoform X2 [Babylonia areolata]